MHGLANIKLPDLCNSCVLEDPAEVEFAHIGLGWWTICVYKEVRLKSKLYARIWSAAAWPHQHPLLTSILVTSSSLVLSFQRPRIWHAFKKRCYFNLFTSYTFSHKLWKVFVSLIMSVLLYAPISSAPTGQISLNFNMGLIWKSIKEIPILLNLRFVSPCIIVQFK